MKRLEELGVSAAPWSFVKSNRDYEVSDLERFSLSYEDRYELPNARLIAAAPKMYDCLRAAVIEMCHGHACCGEDFECNGVDGDCFVKKWRAVLAEAAGENEVK